MCNAVITPISDYPDGNGDLYRPIMVRRRASEASKRAAKTKTRSEATTIIALTSNSLQHQQQDWCASPAEWNADGGAADTYGII